MRIGRRKFLKLAGASGAAGCAPISLLSEDRFRQGNSAQTSKWAMVIDIKKCRQEKDCSTCMAACHRVHNVPDFGNTKDEIKWIWQGPFGSAFAEQSHEFQGQYLQSAPVLLLCNHCDNPPCVGVCPARATWKRSDGIVMMDWHRCIGCRYCMAACPYGSRSFNWRDPRPFIKEITSDFPTRTRGVVEKCNLCEERMAKGQPPACVKACLAGALAFGDLHDPNSQVRQLLSKFYTIRRKPALGTQPQVYYIV